MNSGEVRRYEVEIDKQTGEISRVSTFANVPPRPLKPLSSLEDNSFQPQVRIGAKRKDALYVQYYDRIQDLYPEFDDPNRRELEGMANEAEKAADVLTFLAQPGKATLKEYCWRQVIRSYKERYQFVFEELLEIASLNRAEEVLASGKKRERYPVELMAAAFKELRTFGALLVLMNQDQISFTPENLKDFNTGFANQSHNHGYFTAGIFEEYRERAEQIEDKSGIRQFDDLKDLPIGLRLITWRKKILDFGGILSNPYLANPNISREAYRRFMDCSKRIFPFASFQERDFQDLGFAQGPGFAILTVDKDGNSIGYLLNFSREDKEWCLRVRTPAIDEVLGHLMAEMRERDREKPVAGLAMPLAIDSSKVPLFLEKVNNHFSK